MYGPFMLASNLNRIGRLLRRQNGIAAVGQQTTRQLPECFLVLDQQYRFRTAKGSSQASVWFLPMDRFVDTRQIDFEGCAQSWFAVNPDMAAALANHTIDGREPQPGALALFFGGEKRLENVRLSRRVHSDSCV